MNKTSIAKSRKTEPDDMLPEYDFDYSKARPNRFAKKHAAAKKTKQEVSDLVKCH